MTPIPETANRHLEERYAHRWFGKYRAFVRDNNDPERLARVRLEIPAVLGTGQANWSEWAYPCFPYGGNEDSGMFYVPEVGASVWAEFEGGAVQHPIWSGAWLARSNPGEQPEEGKRLCPSPTCLDCEDKLERATNRHDDLEHTKYHGHPPYSCPRLKVLLKTETGHTILADDRDGTECLKLIDRAGQGLTFEGRVKPALQTGNGLRRGVREAERGDQLDLASQIVEQRGRVEITDLARQFIRFEAWQEREKIHIQSCDKTRARWQKILLDTTAGREKVQLLGLGGAQEIVIDSAAGAEKILVRDKAGQTVVLDAVGGRITLHDKAGSTVLFDGASGNIAIRSAAMALIN